MQLRSDRFYVLGVNGDNWSERVKVDPRAQLNIMGFRAVEVIAARNSDRYPLAGDQIYFDLDLSADNLPPGSILSIGKSS